MSTDDVHLPDLTGEPEDWRERGICAQTDPETFFPEKGGSTREAKTMCAGCEVKAECLGWALANNERFGIWGGLSERERRRLREPKTTRKPQQLRNRRTVHAEIKRLIEAGLSNHVIAERTNVVIRTVERRRKAFHEPRKEAA